jgi:hypothetical protein
MRVLLLSLLVLLVLPEPVWGAPPNAHNPTAPKGQRRTRKAKKRKRPKVRVTRDEAAGGTHWRIASRQGVLHVWRPPGYDRKRAGIVVFVHGYHVTADRAWKRHHLLEQFRASRQNALFVIVDGPSAPGRPVKFPALSKVLTRVARYARLRLPHGHIVAVSHSAGYRTVVEWLDYRYLSHVVLLDSLYANDKSFHDWMTTVRNHDWHRLTVVARDTRPQVKQLKRLFKSGRRLVELDRLPVEYSELSRRQRGASLVFFDSQYGHSALVTNKKVLPVLLRRTRLRLLR